MNNRFRALVVFSMSLAHIAQAQAIPPELAGQALAEIDAVRTIWGPEDIYIGWPTIAKTGPNELAVAFSGDREEHVCPWGKTQIVRSADGGVTWTQAETINNTPLDDRDAGLIVTREGTWLVSWFTSLAFAPNEKYKRHLDKLTPEIRREYLGYWVRRSEDGGQTWGDMIRVGVSAPHGPIQLRDGRLLYVGTDWGWTTGEERDLKENAVIESRDDGRTWQRIGTVPIPEEEDIASYWEAHVVETGDGTLVAQYRYQPRDSSQHYLRQSESTDGGKTWTTAHPTPMWGYPPHLIRLNNGWLLSTYGVRRAPFGQYACISRDGGKTWDIDNEIRLSAAPNSDHGYPATVQMDDGSLITVYYEVNEAGQKPVLKTTHWRLKAE